MYELNATQVFFVSGGKTTVIISDEIKYDWITTKLMVDIAAVGIIGLIGYPLSIGVYTFQSAAIGLAIGMFGGMINGLNYAYNVYKL